MDKPLVPRCKPRVASPVATTTRQTVEPVDAARHLDPRVWLVWLAAVTGPALIARNPFPLAVLLIVVLTVRAAWAPALPRDGGWGGILRFAVVAAVIGVAFNALTAPFGNQRLVALPGWWPLGDAVTANALLFGLLSAAAILVIVLAGTTAALLADWPELLRSVPARFLPLAVAGSVAWSFVPQTVRTLRDIRDAQRVRGLAPTSARTLVPIIVPLLATSLERATTMAEALEARGFGGPVAPPRSSPTRRTAQGLAVAAGLPLVVAATYLLLDGAPWPAAIVAAVALVLVLLGAGLAGRRGEGRSRYRFRVWRWRDTAVLGSALLSLLATGLTLWLEPDALRYSPYPDILWPRANAPYLLSLGLLLAPAAFAPLVVTHRSAARAALGRGPKPVRGETVTSIGSMDSPAAAIQTRRCQPDRFQRPWASWPPRRRSRIPPRTALRRIPEALAGAGRG